MKKITLNQVEKTFNLEMLIIYFVVFLLTFRVTGHLADTKVHTSWAAQIEFSNFMQSIQVISYPIWHICVALSTRLLAVPAIEAARFMNAVFTIFTMIIIRWTLEMFVDSNISQRIKNYITLALTFVSAICIPLYNNRKIYLGQGSINPWHNPTYMSVKPFAIICFLMFISLYKIDTEEKIKILTKDFNKQNIIFVVFSVFVLISTFAKPSFLQVFLPSVIVFLIIELISSKGRIFSFCLKSALAFIPVELILIHQYIVVFGSQATTDNKVEFSFFEIWKHYSSNIPLSIILFFAFPIYVLIIFRKKIFEDKEILIAIIMVLVGTIQFSLLAESGSRRWDMNFIWGYMLAGLILWIVTTIKFLQIYIKEKEVKHYKLKIIIGCTIFFIHFISGIYYFNLLWNGAII